MDVVFSISHVVAIVTVLHCVAVETGDVNLISKESSIDKLCLLPY